MFKEIDAEIVRINNPKKQRNKRKRNRIK